MRASTSVFGVLLLLVCWSEVAWADVLVGSFEGFQILRYDNAGHFLGTFATGLPGDRPVNMTLGADGNLYVAMRNFGPPVADAIRRFDGHTGALIDTFASGGGLDGPGDLAFGPDGNLFVSSFGMNANSKVIRYNAISGAYMGDFVHVGSGGLKGAEGLVFGPDGNLYVTSRVTTQVLRYDGSTGAFLDVFAATDRRGTNGFIDLLFKPGGNLYVLNNPNGKLNPDQLAAFPFEVLRFDRVTGAFLNVFVRPFVGGSDGSSLAFGPDGTLYVTTGNADNSVRRFDGSTGRPIDEFVPQSSGGLTTAVGLLFAPGLARHDLLVSSSDSSQILRYDATTGSFVGTFASGLSGDQPRSMTVGADGNLYVVMAQDFRAHEATVRRFDGQTGALIDTFVTGGELEGIEFQSPGELVFGPDGNLYLAANFFATVDSARILRYDGSTGAFMGDFVTGGRGELENAQGLVFGPDGNLYVASVEPGQIRRYDGSTGAFLGLFATTGDFRPIDLLFGSDGKLYVLNDSFDGMEVLRFDGLTGAFIDVFVSPFAGADALSSFVFAPDGNLYVTTGRAGDSVRRFDGSTGQPIDGFENKGSAALDFSTGLLFLPSTRALISIDIRPGSSRNTIRPASRGAVGVAILTTNSFDATTVDPATVRFGPNGGTESFGRRRTKDVDGDGDLDLVLHFRSQDSGIVCGDTSAILIGETFDGQAMQGTDAIKTVGCNRG